MRKYIRLGLYTLFTVAIISGTFAVGTFVGANKLLEIDKATTVSGKGLPPGMNVDFEPFWKVWNVINEKYPNGKLSDQEKVWGAVSGLASSLGDPYTVFFPPEEAKLFNETINGSFGGVGMEVGIKDKVLTVISPLKNTPAYNAGIKAGDKILKIDDTPTSDISIDKAVSLIRGKKGTEVRLTIFRDGEKEPLEIKIIRDVISIPTLETKKQKGGIFVIQLYNFSSNAPELFRKSLLEFVDAKTSRLILDLRGNPGGYLDAAIDMASWFLPKGKAVVTEDYGKDSDPKIHRSKGYDIFNKNLRMAILVDGGSASASEILAGALSEHKIATLIGEKTFGKGSVQELIPITPETSLKITIAKWLTPNGVSISENGIKPDITVEEAKEPKEKADQDKDHDPVMERAVQFLILGK